MQKLNINQYPMILSKRSLISCNGTDRQQPLNNNECLDDFEETMRDAKTRWIYWINKDVKKSHSARFSVVEKAGSDAQDLGQKIFDHIVNCTIKVMHGDRSHRENYRGDGRDGWMSKRKVVVRLSTPEFSGISYYHILLIIILRLLCQTLHHPYLLIILRKKLSERCAGWDLWCRVFSREG